MKDHRVAIVLSLLAVAAAVRTPALRVESRLHPTHQKPGGPPLGPADTQPGAAPPGVADSQPAPAPPAEWGRPDPAATLQLAANNPAMHRLNKQIVSGVFTGHSNEIVCTFCLLQVLSVAYQLGNGTVRTELKTALDSPQLGELGDALLWAASAENSTLAGTLLGYYQQEALRTCDKHQEMQEAASRQLDRSRCESIREFVSDIGRQVDFAQPGTTEEINSEVERATGGKIPDLFSPLSADTRLVFASALVFADKWESRLATEEGVFHAATGDVTTELLFTRETLPLLDGASDGVIGVSLPYEQPGIRMYLFTTNDGSDIRQGLNQTHYNQLTAIRFGTYTRVTLPSFDIESKKKSYVDLVTSMGIKTMFRGGMGADDSLKVDKLVHKAVMTTDRDGTQAAGAAGLALVALSAKPQPFLARFDRPFVCSLVHTELGVPFFTAFVADPTVK